MIVIKVNWYHTTSIYINLYEYDYAVLCLCYSSHIVVILFMFNVVANIVIIITANWYQNRYILLTNINRTIKYNILVNMLPINVIIIITIIITHYISKHKLKKQQRDKRARTRYSLLRYV